VAPASVPRALPAREVSAPQALRLRVALVPQVAWLLRERASLPGQPRASVPEDLVSARVTAALPRAA
jgi:hypothetical protein